MGLERIFGDRIRTIAACEIEAFALWNGIAKSESKENDVGIPFWSDIKTFPFERFRGRVSIYSAGFPCQPFSAAGKREGTEDPRHLYPYIASGISAMRPQVVFLENVEGIISSKCINQPEAEDGEPVLLYVLRDLEKRGYRTTWGVFSASEVGAPHQRKRIFIMGDSTEWDVSRVKKRGVRAGKETVSQRTENNDFINRSSECVSDVAHHHHPRLEGRDGGSLQECSDELPVGEGGSQIWPARPGEQQYKWEPPRTAGGNNGRSPEPSVGGNTNGNPCGMDYAELCESCDSRIDELRLLGNGVVPATAERAFRILATRLHQP